MTTFSHPSTKTLTAYSHTYSILWMTNISQRHMVPTLKIFCSHICADEHQNLSRIYLPYRWCVLHRLIGEKKSTQRPWQFHRRLEMDPESQQALLQLQLWDMEEKEADRCRSLLTCWCKSYLLLTLAIPKPSISLVGNMGLENNPFELILTHITNFHSCRGFGGGCTIWRPLQLMISSPIYYTPCRHLIVRSNTLANLTRLCTDLMEQNASYCYYNIMGFSNPLSTNFYCFGNLWYLVMCIGLCHIDIE